MTDQQNLVERARAHSPNLNRVDKWFPHHEAGEAAQLLCALADEVERLKGLLRDAGVDPDRPIPPFPNLVADRLRQRIEAVKKLHSKFGLHDVCDHDYRASQPQHHDDRQVINGGDEVGYTCTPPQWVCRECDTDDGEVNEFTEYGKWPCPTLKALGVGE